MLSLSGFGSRWDASGQIPVRAVNSGLIDRFGAIDPEEGGHTARFDAQAVLRGRDQTLNRREMAVYATRYDLRLFSNFTFFLNDSINGDGIEQRDARTMLGLRAQLERESQLLGRPGSWAAGADLRTDFADVLLGRQRERTSLVAIRSDAIRQTHAGGWLRHDVQLSDLFRVQAGLRADVFRFDVRDRLEQREATDARWLSAVNPRVSIAATLTPATSAFFEAQFATTSRPRGELTGVTELHFTPGAPRSLTVGVEYRFR